MSNFFTQFFSRRNSRDSHTNGAGPGGVAVVDIPETLVVEERDVVYGVVKPASAPPPPLSPVPPASFAVASVPHLPETTAPAPAPAALAPAPAAPAAPVAKETGGKSFVAPDILPRLAAMTQAQHDAFDFGCVRVDDEGTVQMYNRYESELAGVDPANALGKNFFRQLAPCTNNRLVYGRFKDGVAAGNLDVIASYAFTYKMRPTLVRIQMWRDGQTNTNWVLVKKVAK